MRNISFAFVLLVTMTRVMAQEEHFAIEVTAEVDSYSHFSPMCIRDAKV
jgi:hypothetical protein